MEGTINLNNVAEVQLSYKSIVKAKDRLTVGSAKEAYNILLNSWGSDSIEHTETFNILLLNRANKVLGFKTVSTGGVAGTVVDPKVVFQAALLANASSIILAHNHPSGNTKPSTQDMSLTKKLVDGGKLLDIAVLDHLIVTLDSYYSFSDEGDI